MMELYITILIIVTICIMFSVCGWCCKRHKQGVVYGYTQQPITTTHNAIHTAPVVVPPYPTDARHPTPQVIQPPAPGFAVPPSTGGYPPTTGGGYPPAAGFMPTNPYPPQGMNNQSAPPPSYTEAVCGGMPLPQQGPTNELYAKQMPYNPNYS